MTVTVYSKANCVQCKATMRTLDSKGIAYEVVNLDTDKAALDRVQALGYRQAPVVETGEQHWSGFRPDLIAAIA
mgnify:CR=1 FL=1